MLNTDDNMTRRVASYLSAFRLALLMAPLPSVSVVICYMYTARLSLLIHTPLCCCVQYWCFSCVIVLFRFFLKSWHHCPDQFLPSFACLRLVFRWEIKWFLPHWAVPIRSGINELNYRGWQNYWHFCCNYDNVTVYVVYWYLIHLSPYQQQGSKK